MAEHQHETTFFDKVKGVIDNDRTPSDTPAAQVHAMRGLVKEAEPTRGRVPLSQLDYSTLCLALNCYDTHLTERAEGGDNREALEAERSRVRGLADFFAKEQGLQPLQCQVE